MRVPEPTFTPRVISLGQAPEGAPTLWGGETGFRLDQLRDAWNKLYNDVVGRSLAPPPGVPPEFANLVATRYESWRDWYENAAQSFSDVAAVHWGSEFSYWLDYWTDEYNGLRSRAVLVLQAAGRETSAPEMQRLSRSTLFPTWVAPVAAAGLFALGALWVVRRTPRRRFARA